MTRADFLHHAAEAFRARTPNAAPMDRVGLLMQAGHFADLVDAHAPALSYADAVVIEGDTVVVATLGAYEADRVALEARAGEVTSVLRGDELLGIRPGRQPEVDLRGLVLADQRAEFLNDDGLAPWDRR